MRTSVTLEGMRRGSKSVLEGGFLRLHVRENFKDHGRRRRKQPKTGFQTDDKYESKTVTLASARGSSIESENSCPAKDFLATLMRSFEHHDPFVQPVAQFDQPRRRISIRFSSDARAGHYRAFPTSHPPDCRPSRCVLEISLPCQSMSLPRAILFFFIATASDTIVH